MRVKEGVYLGLLERAHGEVESRGRELINADRGEKSTTSTSEDQMQQTMHIADHANQPPSGRILTVGVSCEMGRHRSVAFVEELSGLKWPQEWAVRVVHRDVDKRRQRKEKGKVNGGRKGHGWDERHE